MSWREALKRALIGIALIPAVLMFAVAVVVWWKVLTRLVAA